MTVAPPSTRSASWAVPALLWIAAWGFSTFFLNYATLVPLSVGQGLTPVAGGAVLTTMMVCVVAVQPAAPALQRRWGPRAALAAALVLLVAGQGLGLLIPHALAALTAVGVTSGVGFGLLVVLATAAVPEIARPGRVGGVLGIFGAVTAAAGAVGAPGGLWLSGAVPPTAFRLLAGGGALLAMAALPLLPRRSRGRAPAAVRTSRPARTVAGTVAAARSQLAVLGPALLPFLITTVAFGTIIAFGPGTDVSHQVALIATMQVSSVLGRWVAGTLTDRTRPVAVNSAGVVLAVGGLVLVAAAPATWALAAGAAVFGLGAGAVQSSSLVLSFSLSGDPGRGSVWWNMNYDIGLALAGVVGGVGFAALGDSVTFLICAILLGAAGLLQCVRARAAGPADDAHRVMTPTE